MDDTGTIAGIGWCLPHDEMQDEHDPRAWASMALRVQTVHACPTASILFCSWYNLASVRTSSPADSASSAARGFARQWSVNMGVQLPPTVSAPSSFHRAASRGPKPA